jgi:hypothetical protein
VERYLQFPIRLLGAGHLHIVYLIPCIILALLGAYKLVSVMDGFRKSLPLPVFPSQPNCYSEDTMTCALASPSQKERCKELSHKANRCASYVAILAQYCKQEYERYLNTYFMCTATQGRLIRFAGSHMPRHLSVTCSRLFHLLSLSETERR